MQNFQFEPDGDHPDDSINESDTRDPDQWHSSAEPNSASAPDSNFGVETAGNPPLVRESPLEFGDSLNPGDVHSIDPGIFDKTQFYTLDSRFIKSERLGNTIFTCLVLLGALIWMAIRLWMEGADLFLAILAGASLVVVTMLAILAWIWPKKEFRHTQWRATEAGLEIHKGVIWRHRIIVPMSRVQHADVTQGPIQRMFGLGTLVVHTAGTSNASVDLAGIDHQAAIEVRDMIIRFRSDKQEGQA
jgi:uncharacterized protein